MASAPGRFSINVRSTPTQQTMSQPNLRWVNAVSTPAAVKAPPSPVKKWPPPNTHAQPPPVIAITKATPAADKKKAVSAGFQSARAVFEAKKSPAASPSTTPSQSRLKFPVSAAPTIVKQHSTASDRSVSSSSTVDSETDRKEIEREVSPPFLTEPIAATKASKFAVAKVASHSVVPLTPVKTQEVHAAQPRGPTVVVSKKTEQPRQKQSNREDIDPYRLLAPVEAVPLLPDEVALLYDNAAMEMQKNIKKVVRKLLNKNKVRLEEFKVNARLFGTEFLDAHSYLNTLINDFGAIRALQLVPCLMSIQPDILKSSALLLTTKNYLLRNEAELERQCQVLRATYVEETSKTKTALIANSVSRSAIAPSSKISSPEAPPAITVKPVALIPGKIAKLVGLANKSPAGQSIPSESVSFPPAVPLGQEREAEITIPKKVELTIKVTTKTEEPMPEPQELTRPEATPYPTASVASVPGQVAIPTLPVKVITPYPVLKAHVGSLTPSDSGKEDDCRAENLFGEPIKPAPQKKKYELSKAKLAAVVTSPASSTHSFDDAESLFGERLSISSPSSVSRSKTVTWGETQSVEIPSPPKRRKAPPAPLIFGPATAGAFDSDSDSDESDFSD